MSASRSSEEENLLHIAIVGSGLAGLTAGMARAGHRVPVFAGS